MPCRSPFKTIAVLCSILFAVAFSQNAAAAPGHRWAGYCISKNGGGGQNLVVRAPYEALLTSRCGRYATDPAISSDWQENCTTGNDPDCVADDTPHPAQADPLVPYESPPLTVSPTGPSVIAEWANLDIYAPIGDYLKVGRISLTFTPASGGYKVDYSITDFYPQCRILARNNDPVELFFHVNDAPTAYFSLQKYKLGNDRIAGPVTGTININYGQPISIVRIALRGYCPHN